tara:strand:+ start:68145 stop:69548 length:1404 start_codon:yes stop_codon:yes gene_type:complete
MTNLAFPPLPILIDDNESLAREITLLAGQINAANHRLLKMIAEFDRREGWSRGGTVRSCAHWLNWKCGIALGAGREKVRVAHSLESLPMIDAAFAAGEISYSKVRAMTRVATPENEDFLLTIAQYGTASHVEKAVAKYRSVQTKNADEAESEQHNERKLAYYQDQDGMWVIHAKLPPEAGALVIKAIEAVANPVQEERQEALKAKDKDKDKEQNVSAETLFQDLLEHTRADALVSIAEHFLASADQATTLQGLKGSERCQLLLHVDINTLRQHHSKPGPCHEHCHMGDKHWMSPNTAKRLACDTSLITVLEDEQGTVLNIGRKTRTVPSNIGRALSLRDKTCRFPGCCESRYVDAHHIRHWADGGETSLDNLVTLCRYHHRQLHGGGFSIRAVKTTAGQELVFTTPSGREIESSVFPQFPDVSAETSRGALRAIAPKVDYETAVTNWRGEDCDYGMVVEGLLGRDGQ